MQFIINQKFFTIGNKFQIADQNGNPWFLGQEKLFRLARQSDLYDLKGNQIYHIHKRYLTLFGKFELTQNEKLVGEFIGRPSLIIKRYRFSSDKGTFYIKAGPFRLKAFKADENWQYDKEKINLEIKKKLFRIKDSYTIDFDEKVIDPAVAATIGIWYDILVHSGSQNHGIIDAFS